MRSHLIFVYLVVIIENACGYSYYTSRMPHFPRYTVPYDVTPVYGNRGVITSPDYPSNYPNSYGDGYRNESAKYLTSIYVPSDVQYVELTFTTFDIEECGSACTCDGLYVSALPHPLCGTSLPNGNGVMKIERHQITDGRLSFYFYSDGSATKQGFYLKYLLVREKHCTTVFCNCQYGFYYSQDTYGCPVCVCKQMPTSNPIVAIPQRSLLLEILLFLEHRTETVEQSVHDLQEQVKLAVNILQGGVIRRKITKDAKTN